jgi:hypothetical protein
MLWQDFFPQRALILTMAEQSKGLEGFESGLKWKHENRISSKPGVENT